MRLRTSSVITAGVLFAAAGGPVLAQANFFEDFEDIGPPSFSAPSVLVQRGWIFRNQSQPLGSRSWFSGINQTVNPIYFNAQAGERYIASDEGATSQAAGGQISTWAILPPVQGQQAGDLVKLYARKLGGTASLEIRYSPSGGTSTGTGVTGVGDFTQILLTAADISSGGWTAYQTNVPGTGRIAVRHVGTWQGSGYYSPYVGVDSVSVGAPPPPPCNLPPIPQPGQTVTWTAAGGPYQVCENVTIPAGGTVDVEPGVVVTFDDKQLNVAGTLNINGTQAQPVVFNPTAAWPPNITVNGGTLNADWAVFNQQVHAMGPATVHLRDSRVQTANGVLKLGDQTNSLVQTFAHLERVHMQDGDLITGHCMLVLEDCTLQDVEAWIVQGVTDFRGTNVVTGVPIQILRSWPSSPIQVSNIHASNVPNSGGIVLWGAQALIGPNVVLQNNKYTLSFADLYMGSIMQGSQLPVTGNQHNVIDVGRGVGSIVSRWLNVGLPYRLTIANHPIDPDFGPHIIIDPGVRVEHVAGAYLVGKYNDVQLMGLPDQPIEIVPTSPGVPHLGPWYGGAENPKLEYTRLEGMVDGLTAQAGTTVWMDNCIFQQNQNGVQIWGTAGLRGGWNQFLGNSIGVSGSVNINSPLTPNSFEGNGIAVSGPYQYTTDARNCWWNSPSGPQHPQNPGGTGEVIGGDTIAVQFQPWLTQRPDYTNHPPVVRMGKIEGAGIHPNQTPYPGNRWPRTNQGSKVILHWQASDDDQIVSQKLVFTRFFQGTEVVLADNIPPGQRSIEVTIPSFGHTVNTPSHLRLYATDSTGKVGWDQVRLNALQVTSQSWLTFDDSMYAGQTFVPGQAPGQGTFQSNVPWEHGVAATWSSTATTSVWRGM